MWSLLHHAFPFLFFVLSSTSRHTSLAAPATPPDPSDQPDAQVEPRDFSYDASEFLSDNVGKWAQDNLVRPVRVLLRMEDGYRRKRRRDDDPPEEEDNDTEPVDTDKYVNLSTDEKRYELFKLRRKIAFLRRWEDIAEKRKDDGKNRLLGLPLKENGDVDFGKWPYHGKGLYGLGYNYVPIAKIIIPTLFLAGICIGIPGVINAVRFAPGNSAGRSNTGKTAAAGRKTSVTSSGGANGMNQVQDLLSRFHAIYEAATHSDKCMERLMCEAGHVLKDVRQKDVISGVARGLMPSYLNKYLGVFERHLYDKGPKGLQQCSHMVCPILDSLQSQSKRRLEYSSSRTNRNSRHLDSPQPRSLAMEFSEYPQYEGFTGEGEESEYEYFQEPQRIVESKIHRPVEGREEHILHIPKHNPVDEAIPTSKP